LIAFHLDAQERAARQEAALLGERETAELREQFIAVLGHDLRNPLASIEAGARLLLRRNLDEKSVAILGQLQKSTSRMAALIGDMLDFARGRLGGGFALDRDPACQLGPVLELVVEELRAAWPGRPVETAFDLSHPVDCDPARIAQLLSNLAGNALKHGTGTVEISAGATNGIFELAVENEGEPIPRHVSERLFQPFFRVARRSGYEGLGLGLYIASEIARAHGGALTVQSHGRQTRFSFRMPLGGDAAASLRS
jgi:signal transduction histidine kinase